MASLLAVVCLARSEEGDQGNPGGGREALITSNP
jgi:hypothetical protein